MRWVLLGLACVLAGCQQPEAPAIAAPMPVPGPVPGPDPVPIDGVGYLIFKAPITVSSSGLFIADIDKLLNAGAREIHIGINSPGGDIDAAQRMVDYMNRQHEQNGVVFKAYDVGLVASAATYLFLNAQGRYTDPRGVFLFHAAAVISSGVFNADMLRDQTAKLDAYQKIMQATLKARTNLTDSEAQTYVRRTVALSSDDARRDGVVDAVLPFVVPKSTRIWIIRNKVPPVAPHPAAPLASPPP